MSIDIFAVLDHFEKMDRHRTIAKFEFIEVFLCDLESIAIVEAVDGHLMDDALDEYISVFVNEKIFQLFILELVYYFAILLSLCAFIPDLL